MAEVMGVSQQRVSAIENGAVGELAAWVTTFGQSAESLRSSLTSATHGAVVPDHLCAFRNLGTACAAVRRCGIRP
ncbi:MAG: hypothetical protein ACM3ML_19635 [Micromonosporaceae bacterium]